MKMLEANLSKILKIENGQEEKQELTEASANTIAFEQTIDRLKKETGRESFTMEEIVKWQDTIAKHREGKRFNPENNKQTTTLV